MPMNFLVCAQDNTDVEVEDVDDVVTCPTCGDDVSRENAGEVIYREGTEDFVS